MRDAFLGIALTLAGITSPAAQDTAWFGTPPPPMSDPRKPVMKYDDAFGPVPAHFSRIAPGSSMSCSTARR